MSVEQPANEYDPLAKLYRAERSLMEAAHRGEPVAERLIEIRSSIKELVKQRVDQRDREQDGGRHR